MSKKYMLAPCDEIKVDFNLEEILGLNLRGFLFAVDQELQLGRAKVLMLTNFGGYLYHVRVDLKHICPQTHRQNLIEKYLEVICWNATLRDPGENDFTLLQVLAVIRDNGDD